MVKESRVTVLVYPKARFFASLRDELGGDYRGNVQTPEGGVKPPHSKAGYARKCPHSRAPLPSGEGWGKFSSLA